MPAVETRFYGIRLVWVLDGGGLALVVVGLGEQVQIGKEQWVSSLRSDLKGEEKNREENALGLIRLLGLVKGMQVPRLRSG
jgi:hypothetical protein